MRRQVAARKKIANLKDNDEAGPTKVSPYGAKLSCHGVCGAEKDAARDNSVRALEYHLTNMNHAIGLKFRIKAFRASV